MWSRGKRATRTSWCLLPSMCFQKPAPLPSHTYHVLICTVDLSLALFRPLPHPRTPTCSHNLRHPAAGERRWHGTAGQHLRRSPAEEHPAQWWHGGIGCPPTHDPAQHCLGRCESEAARPLICTTSRDWDSPPRTAERSEGPCRLQRLYHSTCHTAQGLFLSHSASSASGSERFVLCPRESVISLRKAGWDEKTQNEKEKKWVIRKPVSQGVLSCKIAIEYFPGVKVKSWLLKKKQLGGTMSWPFAQERQANSAQPFHNFFNFLAGVWKLIYRFTFKSKRTHAELSFRSVTSTSETQFALKTNKFGSL